MVGCRVEGEHPVGVDAGIDRAGVEQLGQVSRRLVHIAIEPASRYCGAVPEEELATVLARTHTVVVPRSKLENCDQTWLAGRQFVSVSARGFAKDAGDVDSHLDRCRSCFLGGLRLVYGEQVFLDPLGLGDKLAVI